MSSRNLPGFLRRSRRYDEEEDDAGDDEIEQEQGDEKGASSPLEAHDHQESPIVAFKGTVNSSQMLIEPSRDFLPPLFTSSTTSVLSTGPIVAPGTAHANNGAASRADQADSLLSDSWQEVSHDDSHTHQSATKDSQGSRPSYREQQFLKTLVEPDIVNMAELRSLSWNGIPTTYRATAWKILLGYLPTNRQRREATLGRKRKEYKDAMAQHYDIDDNSRTLQEQETLRQVIVDVPRTCPEVPLFRNERIKRILTRILYIFAMRHPASSYVQGINDIASPFITVFLADYYDGQDVLDGSVMHHLSEERLDELEADVYWCLTNLLANIQDHYTSDQPGVQRMVGRLEELVNRINGPLCEHLREQGIEFLQFSFKWMNCLLLREFRLEHVPRLWDTYISEKNGFEDFHVYVCAAYVCQFSSQLQGMTFDDLFGFFQSIQTGDWQDTEIEMLLSQAYVLSTLFGGSDAHLSSANR